jgi:hypothetical protein
MIAMPITFLDGDFMHTDSPALAFGHNARGRTELGTLETRLMLAYPSAFAAYVRRARADKHKGGSVWLWQEGKRQLLFLTVRDSSVGATRLRYVQHVALTLARDYALFNLKELALAPLGNAYERAEINKVLHTWFAPSKLVVWAYG